MLRPVFASALLLYLLAVIPALAQPGCRPQTAYNTLYHEYPNDITGVINGSFSLIFVDRGVADSLLPRGTSFLDDIYHSEIDQSSKDVIPILVRAVYVHDIRAADDQFRPYRGSISFEFPFVDALGDGKTPFRYVYTHMTHLGNPNYARELAQGYGVPHIIEAVYRPECDAYTAPEVGPPPLVPGEWSALPYSLQGIGNYPNRRVIWVSTPRQVTREVRPFGTPQLLNIVRQPRFGIVDGQTVCGVDKLFFGEEAGFEDPVETKGDVRLINEFESLNPLLPEEADETAWQSVYGVRVGGNFVANDFVDCDGLASS